MNKNSQYIHAWILQKSILSYTPNKYLGLLIRLVENAKLRSSTEKETKISYHQYYSFNENELKLKN